MPAYEIAHDATHGRYCRALRELKAGEVILEEQALQAVLHDEEAGRRCHHTFAPGDRLLRCTGCRWAFYSSREAQKAAWTQGHREECAALRACAPKRPPATVCLAAHVFWRQQRQDSLPEAVEALEHHWGELSDERKQQFAQMAVVTREYMLGAGGQALPEPRTVAYLLARFACNNHTICDDELRPIGVGLYPQGAMLNHSCTPNAMQSFSGSRIVFRAIQRIPKGEEATIAYTELAATRAERRAELLTYYHFDIDAGRAAPAESLVATAGIGDRDTIEVYERPPTMQIASADVQMAAVQPGTGNGANATTSQHAASPAAPYDVYEDNEVADAAGPLGRKSAAGAPAAAAVHVQCWGPAFMAGGGTDVSKARQVAEALCTAVRAHGRASRELAGGQAAAAARTATAALQALNAGGRVQLDRMHIWRMRLREVQLRAAIEDGNEWNMALDAAQALLPFYCLVYPKVWPNLGLHMAALAKVAALLDRFGEAADAAKGAVDILRYTHPESQILQDMLRLQHEASMDLQAAREA